MLSLSRNTSASRSPIAVCFNNTSHAVVVSVTEDYESLCRDLSSILLIEAHVCIFLVVRLGGSDRRSYYLGPANTLPTLRLLKTGAGVATLVAEVV